VSTSVRGPPTLGPEDDAGRYVARSRTGREGSPMLG
jgi:hypothetical protein